MNESTVTLMRDEIADALIGQRCGKILVLARGTLAFDFRLPDSRFLLVSVGSAAPRAYFIVRRQRDLEKASLNSTPFVLGFRKRAGGAYVDAVEKTDGERVLTLRLRGLNDFGVEERHSLVIQLTGRSSNLFLLDSRGHIIDRLRETHGDGQEVGMTYAAPSRPTTHAKRDEVPFDRGAYESLSEALDAHYLELQAEQRFQSRARAARQKIAAEITKREKLIGKLESDLANHGDADVWKKRGDLILANLADAISVDGKLLVVDYFDENVPTVEIEIDENESLTENAERFFKRYTKARNARDEIARRSSELGAELAALRTRRGELENAIAARDEDFLDEVAGEDSSKPKSAKAKKSDSFSGARRFLSSDGIEILVGKASKDNDFLTFRVAKSLDLWLHAADYPGSHVVVRNPSRGEIPQKTLLEAAQLAAFYSNAREQPKVAVNYTPRKFVNKPKGAAPGLVSLSSFKTILVEPGVSEGVSR